MAGTAKPKSKTYHFKQDKITANAVRFAEQTEDDERGDIRTVYLRKKAMEELGITDSFELTIKATS